MDLNTIIGVAHPKQRTLKGLAGQTSLLDKDEAAN